MHPSIRSMLVLAALLAVGCASHRVVAPVSAVPAQPADCNMAAATPWIERWFAAWQLTSERILRLSDAPSAQAVSIPGAPETPEMVFFDATCVYTTSDVTAAHAAAMDGPLLRGVKLPWRALAHGGAMTLPDSSQLPVALTTFTNVTAGSTPYFVMAAPSYWEENGHGEEPALTGVFLHEFAHTRQLLGMAGKMTPIDTAWTFPEVLNDDAVQTRFGADAEYVAAYTAERDLLFRAAAAPALDEVRALASEALASMKRRHARWFTGDAAVFAGLDDIFLALEGVGQWCGYAWLAHPEGGGIGPDEALRTMLGRRKWWVQDEGLALLLAVDRLLPGWPELEFRIPALGATELLERAVAAHAPR